MDAPATTAASLPLVDQFARASRAMARARTFDEVVGELLAPLNAAGLRALICEIDGDNAVVRRAGLPADLCARGESLVQRPLEGIALPLRALPSLRTIVEQRAAANVPAFWGELIASAPRVVGDAATRLRRIADATAGVVPVEAGERLLGLAVVWGPTYDASQLGVVAALVSQLGWPWAHLAAAPRVATPEPVAAPAPIRGTPARSVRRLIDSGQLRTAVQPIIRPSDGHILAYEALCRLPATIPFRGPDELFAAAAAAGLEHELDLACLRAAASIAERLAPATLFCNIAASTLLTPNGPAKLAALFIGAGVAPERVVLEISERLRIDDRPGLRRAVADLRHAGFRVAIDDAGAGHASMLLIAEARPEFVKVDRSIVTGVHSDEARAALVKSMLAFAAEIGARVIAEGVETQDELARLTGVGVQYAQGYLLGRPLLVEDGVAVVVDGQAPAFAGRRVEPFATIPQPTFPDARPVLRSVRRHGRRRSLPFALSQAAAVLQNEHDPARILQVIAEQLQEVMPVDSLTIYRANLDNHMFEPVLATGPESESVMAYSFSITRGLTGWAFRTARPQNIADAMRHPAAGTIPGTAYDVKESLLLIPLVAGDRRIGMLNCKREGVSRFSARDLEAASLFAHTAAAAWHNAELYQELSTRTMTDALTGLYNSRWMRDIGEPQIIEAAGVGRSTAVLLVDLDHFKVINDTGGHLAGDTVLRRVARALSRRVRHGDALVRLGGEEFLVILHDCGAAGAQRVAHDLGAALAEVELPSPCEPRPVTASIGIAVMPDDCQTLTEAIRIADLAMYRAKAAGRNCVRTAGTAA